MQKPELKLTKWGLRKLLMAAGVYPKWWWSYGRCEAELRAVKAEEQLALHRRCKPVPGFRIGIAGEDLEVGDTVCVDLNGDGDDMKSSKSLRERVVAIRERAAAKEPERELNRRLFELEQRATRDIQEIDPTVLSDLSFDQASSRWEWVEDGPVHRLVLEGSQLAWVVMVGECFVTGFCAEFSNDCGGNGTGTIDGAKRSVEEDLAGEWYGGNE